MPDNAVLKRERQEIHEIRKLFPDRPRKTLAKQIVDGKFDAETETGKKALELRGSGLYYRPVLSVYSVLRRFDEKNNPKKKLAKTAKKALASAKDGHKLPALV